MIASIAQFEREITLTRQREGIRKAHGEGMYKGRAPTAAVKAEEVKALHAQGVGASRIAKQLGIGCNSVYRILDGETTQPGGEAVKSWHSLSRTAAPGPQS